MPPSRSHHLATRLFRAGRGGGREPGLVELFGVVFQPGFTIEGVTAMLDSLSLFGTGESWGDFGGPAIRIHVGLEDAEDLIADLAQALPLLRSSAASGFTPSAS